jgi:hypothetical protein
MPTLQLEQLECIHPDDRTGHDEIIVAVNCDGHGISYQSNLRMGEGDTTELIMDGGIPFTDFAVIRLTELDHLGLRQESLGSVTIGRPLPDGPRTAYLPSEIGGEHATCYRLTYHVDVSEHAALPRNRIELLSLRCDNAQGTHDTVYLYVNERLVWGPADMRTHQECDLGDLSADFQSSATVRLQDVRGSKWASEFTLRYGDEGYIVNRRLTHYFHVDRGIIGDASYTLTYRLRRLPVR